MQYIKIHALDNVAVALADLAEGTEVSVDNQTVTVRQDVARGHKFALTDIAKGANVIKYGLPIGYALADIAAGEHVHAHNTRTNLSDLDQYRYQPDFRICLRKRQIVKCRSIVALTAMSGCVMSCGSCQPWAVSTASRGRSKIVS